MDDHTADGKASASSGHRSSLRQAPRISSASVSIRRTDLRLTLPSPARRAVVLGGLTAWETGLARAGVDVEGGSSAPQLAVAPARLAREAVGTGAPAVLLEGRGGARELRRAGYFVRRCLLLPSLERPSLLLPLERGPAMPYALNEWRPAYTRSKRLRDRLATALVRARAFPPVRNEQTLGLRDPGPPFALAAAEALGVPQDSAWFVWAGQGDPLGRLGFHVFAPHERRPSWVVKVARLPGIHEPFDRDEHGLGLAAGSGGLVTAHAPKLVGRLDVQGLPASVETAALGEPLSRLIERDRDLAWTAVEAVATWIIDLGTATRTPAAALASERHRLRSEVLPPWLREGASHDLADRLPELTGVLQHNDLGSWNIVVEPGAASQFVAVDWESARRPGLPLWDLLYFLVDAFPLLEGARTPEQRVGAAIRMLRGESASSSAFFGWLRRAAAAAGVPIEAVGAVATLCWLHHGLSHVSRRAAAERADPGAAAVLSPIDRLAPLWLRDQALGPEWPAWRS